MTMYIPIILLCFLHATVFCSYHYREPVNRYYKNKHLKFVSPRRYISKDEGTADYSRSNDNSYNLSPRKFDTNVDKKTYILRNVETGLVLESKKIGTNITLSAYSGEKSQRWNIIHVGQGKFVLTNNFAKGALDASLQGINLHRLIIYPEHRNSNQLWFVESDGRIVSDMKSNEKTLALTVLNENKLFAKPINCDQNQRFVIEFA